VIDSFGRYISAIYADRFDSYAGQAAGHRRTTPAAGSWCAAGSSGWRAVKVDMMRRNGEGR
jgi:hypothetical protein